MAIKNDAKIILVFFLSENIVLGPFYFGMKSYKVKLLTRVEPRAFVFSNSGHILWPKCGQQ